MFQCTDLSRNVVFMIKSEDTSSIGIIGLNYLMLKGLGNGC